jgi:hypothetical protein
MAGEITTAPPARKRTLRYLCAFERHASGRPWRSINDYFSDNFFSSRYRWSYDTVVGAPVKRKINLVFISGTFNLNSSEVLVKLVFRNGEHQPSRHVTGSATAGRKCGIGTTTRQNHS